MCVRPERSSCGGSFLESYQVNFTAAAADVKNEAAMLGAITPID